jgi:hypothetical protein
MPWGIRPFKGRSKKAKALIPLEEKTRAYQERL